MQDEAHIYEWLPAYTLGCLDEAEADVVRSHLASCYLCRTELDSFQVIAGQLALSVTDAAPSPDVKRRLMERVQSLPSRSGLPTRNRARSQTIRLPQLPRLAPVWGAVSLLLIVGLAAISLLLWQQISNLQVLNGPLGMRAIALSNNMDIAPQASGFVLISPDGEDGALVVDALPALDPSRQYQAWLLRDEQWIPGPAFTVDEHGYRGARIEAPDSLLSYSELHITIEPIEAQTVSPTGEQVLNGSLHNP